MALTDAQKVVRNDTGKRMATALEGIETALGGLGSDNAKKADLTAISATGTTNATGATIMAGTYFYLNGALVQAQADIAIGAAFTNGTNYADVTAGGLNSLNAGLASLNSQNVLIPIGFNNNNGVEIRYNHSYRTSSGRFYINLGLRFQNNINGRILAGGFSSLDTSVYITVCAGSSSVTEGALDGVVTGFITPNNELYIGDYCSNVSGSKELSFVVSGIV